MSKFRTRTLRHDSSILREEDGEVRFDDLIEKLKEQFGDTLQWTVNIQVNSLAQRGHREEEGKKRYQYCLNPDASNTSLYFRAIQGDSGANFVNPLLQDNVLLPGWLRRAHPPRRERLRDAFHYLKWIDPREDEATRSTGGPVAKAKQRPKSTLKLSPVSVPNRGRKWIDINPETFSKGCFAVLKFMIGLLRHEENTSQRRRHDREFQGRIRWHIAVDSQCLGEFSGRRRKEEGFNIAWILIRPINSCTSEHFQDIQENILLIHNTTRIWSHPEKTTLHKFFVDWLD